MLEGIGGGGGERNRVKEILFRFLVAEHNSGVGSALPIYMVLQRTSEVITAKVEQKEVHNIKREEDEASMIRMKAKLVLSFHQRGNVNII